MRSKYQKRIRQSFLRRFAVAREKPNNHAQIFDKNKKHQTCTEIHWLSLPITDESGKKVDT